jgi:hypothetical protein
MSFRAKLPGNEIGDAIFKTLAALVGERQVVGIGANTQFSLGAVGQPSGAKQDRQCHELQS